MASLLLCFCLITQSAAVTPYNVRSMPFIEMMVTMMRIMNQMMGGSHNYSGLNHLPYSPAFAPGMGNGLGGFNNLPMSPAGFNTPPFYNMNYADNLLQNDFQAAQKPNNVNNPTENFWQPGQHKQKSVSVSHYNLNGIWQAFSGDVIAIYHNNRFIWTDGNARNLAGHLQIKGNKMVAYIPAKNVTLQFQFYKEPGQFIVRDQNSRVYTFKRIH